MKLFNKTTVLALMAGLFLFSACEKVDPLTVYPDGIAPVLSASATTVAAAPADSNSVALSLSWTDPKHSQDTSLYKFLIEIDSTGRNFSKAKSFIINGKKGYSFLAKELNAILLGYGFDFNKAYDMDVRVTSSYGNNNELKRSNTLKIRMTPYKVPPKIQLPASGRLFIVGDATQGGWTNTPPLPMQELSQIDETTFGGVFFLNGGNQYLFLIEYASWDFKYAIPNNGLPGIDAGGDFAYYTSGGDNFKAPAASGWYKITIDFQRGKYTVAPFTQQHDIPNSIWIVGNAFSSIPDWTNPGGGPMPTGSEFTRRTSTVYDITVDMKGGGEYLLLPFGYGNWSKYAIADKNAVGASASGVFAPEAADNFPGPSAAGTYKVSVNLFNNTYKVVKQ